MVLVMAKPKNRKSTIKPGMRGRDAARKLTLKVDIFTGIHDRFLRDPVSRDSQLAIGCSEQKCKELDELAKKRPYISSHSRGKEKIPRTMVSHLEQSRQKWANELRSDFRAAVSMKSRPHHESGEQVDEPISPEQHSSWHPSSSTSWWNKNCK